MDVMGTRDLIVDTTATAVEAHAHQRHAQTDDRDDTENSEATDGTDVVVYGIEAQIVAENHDECDDDRYAGCRVFYRPRQIR